MYTSILVFFVLYWESCLFKISDARTFTTKLPSKSTTLDVENKTSSTEGTVSFTLEKTRSYSPYFTTQTEHLSRSISKITTTLPMSVGSTTILPSFINSYYPILLGILGVCFLFLIIFTVYVSLHIHEKCSRKRKSKVIAKEDIETYQDIHDMDLVGNFTKYDSLNRRTRLRTPNSSSLIGPTQGVEVSIEVQEKRENDYSEIYERGIMSEGLTADIPVERTDSLTTESSTGQTPQQGTSNTKDHSPPKDSHGYMLPKSGNFKLDNAFGISLNVNQESSPEDFRLINTSNPSIETSDDVNDAYLTVISK